MSPVDWITVAFALTLIVTAVLTSQLAIERGRNRLLRSTTHAECDRLLAETQGEVRETEERAAHWRDRFEALGYRDPVFETPEQFHQRQAMERHVSDALAVIEEPGAQVVRLPAQRDGGQR